jgi:pimeloyl-ACP methyl ester carboxylesterase
VSTRYVLIPGAGGSAWYWHRVAELLASAGVEPVSVELPMDDDAADLFTYADIACRAVAQSVRPVVVVGQSMGAFTAPMVAARVPTSKLLLVNPMVPSPGESAGQWWEATGQKSAMVANFRRIGLGDKEFDVVDDFFHDVPAELRDEALRQPEPRESDTPFEQPWPLPAWPQVPTVVIAGRDDRLFPLDFQRRVVRDRLGLDVDVMPGGHLMALSQPEELTRRLLAAGGVSA